MKSRKCGFWTGKLDQKDGRGNLNQKFKYELPYLNGPNSFYGKMLSSELMNTPLIRMVNHIVKNIDDVYDQIVFLKFLIKT